MSAPAFEIQIGPRGSAPAFCVRNAFGEEVTFGDRHTLDKKILQQPLLRNWLEEIVTAAGAGRDLDWTTADDIVQRIYVTGFNLLLELTVSNRAIMTRLEEVMQHGLASSLGGGTTTIQIVAPNDDDFANTLPFEILPLFNLQVPPKVTDHPSLEAAMSAFLGFSAIIERSSFQPSASLKLSAVDGKLRVALFHHAGLPAAKKERSYLTARADVALGGPYPAANDPKEKLLIAGQIANAGILPAGGRASDIDQIHHFACHCETNVSTESHFISLMPDQGTEFDLDLKELLEKSYRARDGVGDRPLVIFNNCGGAAVDPRQIGSFLHFFSKHNNNRGFIGIQARLPDRLAAAFSLTFYDLVLRRRQKIGEALANTRRQLVLQHANPLAILYAYYGSPELSVQ